MVVSANRTVVSTLAFCILTKNIKQATSKNLSNTGCEDGRGDVTGSDLCPIVVFGISSFLLPERLMQWKCTVN
jgi:hypothetical protein